MIKNYGESVEINHYLNWPDIPNRRYTVSVIGDSGLDKPINLFIRQ